MLGRLWRLLHKATFSQSRILFSPYVLCTIITLIPLEVQSIHHMRRDVPQQQLQSRQSNGIPILVINNCAESIWPGLSTQGGTGPDATGFELSPGSNRSLSVSQNWQGRLWGRTNCSFPGADDAQGGPTFGGNRACRTGDCNGQQSCTVTGDTPVTLAEFTLDGGDGQTYYDLSLVDGYNLPMAIVMLPLDNSRLQKIPPNLTNPSCQGTASLLAPDNFNPYSGQDSQQQQFLGTNSTYPLPFDEQVSNSAASRWCPWNLQVNPPEKPGDGVYPYPDDDIERPFFNPCYSACAKWSDPQDCCTGKYGSPSSCSPSDYSKAAKMVCPDAYSYAFDDQTSTFIVPIGAGFEVVFCPGARSTTILSSRSTTSQTGAQNRQRRTLQSSSAAALQFGPAFKSSVIKTHILAFAWALAHFTKLMN